MSNDDRLSLSCLAAQGYTRVDVTCHGLTGDGQPCWHHAVLQISVLIAAGVDPRTSLNRLPLRCLKCGGREFDARFDITEHYEGCFGRDERGLTNWVGRYGPIEKTVPTVSADIAKALQRGSYP